MTGTTTHHRTTSSTSTTKKRHSGGFYRQGVPSFSTRKDTGSSSLRQHTGSSRNLKTKSTEIEYSDDDELDMVTGFLQFCTICEKQIDSRNKSVLYCSENCRKEDCGHASSVTSSPRSPIEPPIFKVKEDPPCDIIPQRSPTITTHKPLFSLGGDMPTSETESMDGSEHQKRPSTPRTHSEAASYLGQFHSGVSRPTRFRMSKSTTAINVPSLSTSSNSSTSTSLPFTPASEGYPSLPPRINPHGSIHGFGHKSADLVTPVAFPPTGPASLDTVMTHTPEKVKNVEEPGMEATVEAPSDAKVSYEKRKGIAGNGASPGSLKHLLDEKKAMG